MHYNRIRIAAFGCRYLPPKDGSAGEDKFASELYPRIVKLGHSVVVYTRVYTKQKNKKQNYRGVTTIALKTVRRSGFDTFIHSLKATFHILVHNTGNIIHIHNGGNSIWAFILRLFGKNIFISQDGIDWKRDKWKWYGKQYLFISTFITAYIPNRVIFDNIFSKQYFEKRFKKRFDFIPYGSEVSLQSNDLSVLDDIGIKSCGYFLFVGRFIPDKGLHYLIKAFEQVKTDKKLVLIGGSPNESEYEKKIRGTNDSRIIFPGFIYGDNVNILIKNAYAYIQPSDVEGLSPVILQVMGLGTPLLCSDIPENKYIVKDDAIIFKKGNVQSLKDNIEYLLKNVEKIYFVASLGKERIMREYNWDTIVDQYLGVFIS